MSQFALAWCAQQRGVTSPIIGPRTLAQLKDKMGALDVEVTEEDSKRADGVVASGMVALPYYELDTTAPKFRW